MSDLPRYDQVIQLSLGAFSRDPNPNKQFDDEWVHLLGDRRGQ